jgi:NAD dependent epimerase/dehydratase family
MVITDSHLRRPLYPIEKSTPPTTVCMTGANGYVGSSITERLLAMGHTVHAAVIDANDEEALAHLKELPGAERLKLFTVCAQPPTNVFSYIFLIICWLGALLCR